MFRLRTTVVAQCERFWENGVLAIVPFYAIRWFGSVPFCDTILRSIPFSHRFAKDKTQTLTPYKCRYTKKGDVMAVSSAQAFDLDN